MFRGQLVTLLAIEQIIIESQALLSLVPTFPENSDDIQG